MKSFLLSLSLVFVSIAAFAQNSYVCERHATFDKLCSPTFDGRLISTESDGDIVCKYYSYEKGAVRKSMVGSNDKVVAKKLRTKYLGTIVVKDLDKAKKIYETKAKPSIYSIDCAK